MNYYPFNSDLYPNAKHLHFDLSQHDHRREEIITNSSFLHQLESLTLSGNSGQCDEFCIYGLEELPICDNIKKLSLLYSLKI